MPDAQPKPKGRGRKKTLCMILSFPLIMTADIVDATTRELAIANQRRKGTRKC
jgi:hypothetical protein